MNAMITRRSLFLGATAASVAWAGAAEAKPLSFAVSVSGANAVPPLKTAGTGTAQLTYDPATRVVTWSIAYKDLSSPATMAHFHNGAAGKNGPVVIWLTTKGVPPTSPIKGRATLSAAQAKAFLAGDWYINVHSQAHPAGEIRGQVIPPKG